MCADSFDPSIPSFVQEEQSNINDDNNPSIVDNTISENDDSSESNIFNDIGDESNENHDLDNDFDNDFNNGRDTDNDNGLDIDRDEVDEFSDDESLLEPYRIASVHDNLINGNDLDDDFGDFLVTAEEPDSYHEENHDFFPPDTIPTTDTGEKAQRIIESDGWKQNKVSGHVILNQCGSLLSRRNHDINGSSKHKFFLQKIHSTSDGESIPLLYPESMLFPSIFPFSDPDGLPSVGCIPAPLLSTLMEKIGFESIPQHTRTRLTVPFCK